MTSRSTASFHLGSGHQLRCSFPQLHTHHNYHRPECEAEACKDEQYGELPRGRSKREGKRPEEPATVLTEDKRASQKAVRILE